jgi:hypothetical protein
LRAIAVVGDHTMHRTARGYGVRQAASAVSDIVLPCGAMSERQPPLSIKWVIIGTAVMGGLSWLLPLLLIEPLLPPLLEHLHTFGWFVFVLVIAVGAFFGGSLIVAYTSPGTTIREPAIASTIAVIVNQLFYLRQGGDFSVSGLLIGIAMNYAFAFLGAKVGERLQGDTTDKMRERGEMRR